MIKTLKFCGKVGFCAKNSRSAVIQRLMSTDTSPKGKEPVAGLIYEGPFTGTLKRLRRFSIASTTLACIGFPLTAIFGIPNASISLAGQVAVVGTSLLASVSSTFFLQLVTHPYVTHLYELKDTGLGEEAENKGKDRQFRAFRLNYFGNAVPVHFRLSELSKVQGSQHPYASCQANGTFMYYHGSHVEDSTLRVLLTNDSATYSSGAAAASKTKNIENPN
jgi:hypothetical protein